MVGCNQEAFLKPRNKSKGCIYLSSGLSPTNLRLHWYCGSGRQGSAAWYQGTPTAAELLPAALPPTPGPGAWQAAAALRHSSPLALPLVGLLLGSLQLHLPQNGTRQWSPGTLTEDNGVHSTFGRCQETCSRVATHWRIPNS